jgi:8-oxo-dGTP pyrophosphatase MutT (NUDIX family)
VVVDAERRVLLVRFGHPAVHAAWWATVGGGIEPGESEEEALRRELREEAGLVDVEIGPLVHTRRHVFPWQRRLLDQRERFYLVRVDRHDPAPAVDLAAESVTEIRWWTLDELDATAESIVPPELARLVRTLTP